MIKRVKKYLVAHVGNNYKPHLLRERSIVVLACFALVLFCTSLGSSYLINKTDFGAAVLPSVLVDLTNEHRLANNGKALKINPKLEVAAAMKAKDMADNQYFAHTSPTGDTPWQWFTKAGYNFLYAGENLAINFTESVDVEQAWIGSPTHHANLISDKFDETGIATYQGVYQGRPTIFVVQLFGRQPQAKRVAAVARSNISTVLPPTENSPQAPFGETLDPEVKGETSTVKQEIVKTDEPAPILLLNEPSFSVAQNLNEDDFVGKSQDDDFKIKYSTLIERLLINQAKNVQNIYLGFILLIYLVLIFMVITELKVQHPKNIALAVLLLCFLSALAYINSSFILSFV